MKGSQLQRTLSLWAYTRSLLIVVLCTICGGGLIAQDESMPEKDTRPVKNVFESIWHIDNQTVVVPIKGTLEVDFQHRFGTWDRGYDDFFGVFAPSNMRIGIDYVVWERFMIGIGLVKEDLLWDASAKYAIMRQGRQGGAPVNLTYYFNFAMDTREESRTNFEEATDRASFFNQIMIARKITDALSLQVHGNYSWFNFKSPVLGEDGSFIGKDENGHFGAGALARYKVSNAMAIIAAYDFPLTEHAFSDPEPNLSFGIEFTSSSHAFQIFAGNYNSLSPQYNSTYNQNRLDENEFLLGFNITRLWNF